MRSVVLFVFGVAIAVPASMSLLCISSSWLESDLQGMPCALATPMCAVSSSMVPNASNIASVFGLRSPLYSEELPLSPVFVYTFMFRFGVCFVRFGRVYTLRVIMMELILHVIYIYSGVFFIVF